MGELRQRRREGERAGGEPAVTGRIVRFLERPAAVRTCQVLIGVAFLVAALSKIGDIPAFARQVHNFRVIPQGPENLVAMTLPWIELVAGLVLLGGAHRRSAAIVCFALLAVFTAGVAQAMVRGLDFECGCFGTADHTRVGAFKLLQNLVMLAVAGIASLRPGAGAERAA